MCVCVCVCVCVCGGMMAYLDFCIPKRRDTTRGGGCVGGGS